MDEQPVKPMQQAEKKARPLAWIAVTGILVIVLIASVLTGGFGITGAAIAGTDANTAANKALDFINTIQPGTKAYLNGVGQSNGLYTMNFTVDGQKYMAYISPDGKMLFPSVIDISEPVTAPTQSASTGFNPTKTDKPTIQMFVMSFCPYGKQAEQGVGPAITALGSNVNFEPHFIVTMSGDTINSLHGANEAAEDERQAVIWKYWPAKFWLYVNYVNANATINTINTAWKDAAKAAGLDVTQIEAKVVSDGLTLMKAEAALAQSLGVSSSPTIFVNGASYDGDRSAEAFKTAFCSAF
ncbi:MAG: thioredoxin domain-containing protein, partial [Candidatus Aenigmatarchaeota archaeon]